MQEPLVSIIVITFNSSKYVLETLESAKAQTYRNIELIISDDCSTDNTVEICQRWLEKNREWFVNTNLLTVEQNTGIAPNCNRGVNTSKGVWVKLIAGDDILMTECIEKFLEKSKNIEDNIILCAAIEMFNQDGIISTFYPAKYYNSKTSKEQLRVLLKHYPGTVLNGTSLFVRKNIVISVGGFNEKYPMWEDYPFYLKALEADNRFEYVESTLIRYRIHSHNISAGINPLFKKTANDFLKNEIKPRLKREKLWLHVWHYRVSEALNSRMNKFYIKLLKLLIDPVALRVKVTNKILFFKNKHQSNG